jgi:hypothetical protein
MADWLPSPAVLRRLLYEALHGLKEPAEPDRLASDVWPPPGIIVTVATDADPTLGPEYRQRYFITIADEDYEPLIQHERHFALPELLIAASNEQPEGSRLMGGLSGDFMRGPVRWLWTRLHHFPRILLWPDSQNRQPNGIWFWHDYDRAQAPKLCTWLKNKVPDPSVVGAIVLDLRNLEDCKVLWEVANLVGISTENFYVSDEKAAEVYLLHHDDAIYISIPDKNKRQALLDDLARWPNLFKNCSGYTLESDRQS